MNKWFKNLIDPSYFDFLISGNRFYHGGKLIELLSKYGDYYSVDYINDPERC